MLWKKQTGIGLSLVASLVLILAGCSSGNNESNGATGGGSADEPYELTMAYPGGDQNDLSKVQEEINKITLESINTTVRLLPISFSAWSQQKNLMLASNEALDIIFTLGDYSTDVAKGSLLPLSELLDEYGQDIKIAVGEDFLRAAQINGEIYAVPSVRDYAAGPILLMRKDLVDKNNIDPSAIHTLEDVGRVLQIIKENEPAVTPLTNFAGGTPMQMISRGYIDTLGDNFGVLLGHDDGLHVTNWYESAEYASLLTTLRSWYEAGYFAKDVATSNANVYDMIRSQKAFAYFANNKPGIELQETLASGNELVSASLSEAYSATENITSIMTGIARNTRDKEKAMQFLNLLYSDARIVNLLDWGIEGTHYVVNPDGLISYPEGVDSATVGYNSSSYSFLFGDQTLSYIWEGNDPELWDKLKAFNSDAIKSKAFGFTFDATPVKTVVAALTNVVSQYTSALETGSVETQKILPEFIDKLKAAGIDEVIAEKQRQLDEWAATQS